MCAVSWTPGNLCSVDVWNFWPRGILVLVVVNISNRYATLPNLMKAKKKPIEVIPVETLGVDLLSTLQVTMLSHLQCEGFHSRVLVRSCSLRR